MVKRKDKRG